MTLATGARRRAGVDEASFSDALCETGNALRQS